MELSADLFFVWFFDRLPRPLNGYSATEKRNFCNLYNSLKNMKLRRLHSCK